MVASFGPWYYQGYHTEVRAWVCLMVNEIYSFWVAGLYFLDPPVFPNQSLVEVDFAVIVIHQFFYRLDC